MATSILAFDLIPYLKGRDVSYYLSCVLQQAPSSLWASVFSSSGWGIWAVLSSVLVFSYSGSKAEPLWEVGELSKTQGKAARPAGVRDYWLAFHPQGPCPGSRMLRDSLKEEMATHYSILAWKFLWTEEPGRLQSMESQRVRHNWACVHWWIQGGKWTLGRDNAYTKALGQEEPCECLGTERRLARIEGAGAGASRLGCPGRSFPNHVGHCWPSQGFCFLS